MLASLKQNVELPVTEDQISASDLYPASEPVWDQPSQLADSALPVSQTAIENTATKDEEQAVNEAVETGVSNNLASFTADNSIKPIYKRYVAPNYPQHFWYNQIEQEVIATFKINPSGKVYDIKLNSQINNFVAFEQEVEKAMKRWKFDTQSLNNSTLQRTYQQIFSFAISDEIERNCELKTTGTRLSKPMPCNK